VLQDSHGDRRVIVQAEREQSPHPLIDAVRRASQREDVRAAVEAVCQQVQAEIDRRASIALAAGRPLCVLSGRCCRFDEFGHRLYVTTLELAHFLHRLPLAHPRTANSGGCPFQTQKLCTVHPFRPFGCRIFFCDPASTQWQNDLYERFHADLKRLHETLDVRYFYMEWRQALGMMQDTAL
jgi:Fe-S-cluster containining protein